MSIGFNVETYQVAKQDNIPGGSSPSQEILDRLQRLEDSQMNVANEYYCDFSRKEYIDTFNSNVINTMHGIIPNQHTDTWFNTLTNDDIIDWDKSKGIAYTSGTVKLDSPTTKYGEFFTVPVDLAQYIGFKINANAYVPMTETMEGQVEIKSGCLWFTKGIDNYGRMWLFRYDAYKYEEGSVYLTIYNSDMTIYKESTIPAASFFGAPSAVASYKYSIMFNSAAIVFSEENLCIIAFDSVCAGRNGTYFDSLVSDGNQISYRKTYVTFVDENGNAKNKYNYINSDVSYNYYVYYNQNANHGLLQGFEPCKLFIQKNKIYVTSSLEARWFGSCTTNNARMLRAIISTSTALLNDVNVTVTNYQTASYYYEPYNVNYTCPCSRFGTKIFSRNGVMYHFITDYAQYTTALPIGRMYLAEVKMNAVNNAFDIDNKLALSGTLANQLYGFGGANCIYYSEKYNYLYVFSNAPGSNILYVTRFEVDWSSKTTTGISLKNPLVKNISMTATTYYGSYNTTYKSPTDLRYHYSEKLKVIEDDEKLCLIYGNKSPMNANQQINYMSIDFDMNIVKPETQIHTSNSSDLTTDVALFDIVSLNDKNIVLYSQGNRNDFVDTTADPSSHLFTSISSSVSSKMTWYYSTDTDLTWKMVGLGDSITLLKAAKEMNLKIVLESSDKIDTSPLIDSIYIESWDNGMTESRQSVYCSNQIANMQNEGKAVLTADQDLNDGVIDWYVSYDGGQNYSSVKLDQEFVYTHIETPDFRVKAIISVKDNAKNLPVVRSYTLRTNHVVLHSDLEELQINLMKTNFKIDTLSNASRNGMLKMVTDVFSTEDGIDKTKSDYLPYPLIGAVGGNYIITVPQEINAGSVTVLITTSEILDATNENSHISYFASLDGGYTYKQVYPNIKAQLSNTSSSKNTIIIKAVFYEGAKLSAIGLAWD